ncbi:hypothetical protein TNCV_3917151 [Trichonephila clavipes]|nr:hypothetical protein TNCV_3917151 [Trichonephila clavipes]
MSLKLYSQPPVGIKQSESSLSTPCYSFPAIYAPVSAQARRAARWRALSEATFIASFLCMTHAFLEYSRTVNLKSHSCLTILETDGPMLPAPTIRLRLKASRSGSLAIPTTKSEQERLTSLGNGTRNVPPSHIEMYLGLEVEREGAS